MAGDTKTQTTINIISALVPEIMSFVRSHNATNGQPPTDTEVIEHLTKDADAVVAKGEAWLAAHPEPASKPKAGK